MGVFAEGEFSHIPTDPWGYKAASSDKDQQGSLTIDVYLEGALTCIPSPAHGLSCPFEKTMISEQLILLYGRTKRLIECYNKSGTRSNHQGDEKSQEQL